MCLRASPYRCPGGTQQKMERLIHSCTSARTSTRPTPERTLTSPPRFAPPFGLAPPLDPARSVGPPTFPRPLQLPRPLPLPLPLAWKLLCTTNPSSPANCARRQSHGWVLEWLGGLGAQGGRRRSVGSVGLMRPHLQDLGAYVRTALVLEVGQVASVGQIRVDPPRKEEKSVAARRRAGEGRGGGPEGALAQRRAGWNLIRQGTR